MKRHKKRPPPRAASKKRPQALPAAPESSMFHLRNEFPDQDRGPPGRSCRSGGDSYCEASDPQFPGHYPHPHIRLFWHVISLIKTILSKRAFDVKVKMPCSGPGAAVPASPHLPAHAASCAVHMPQTVLNF